MTAPTPRWHGEGMIVRHDAPTGADILIAIHSTRLGPATGGTRMKPYPTLEQAAHDARRLAEGMTLKWAAAGFPRGGGKAVIRIPEGLPAAAREGLLRRYGSLLRGLGGLFQTGPDVGTGPKEMDLIAETGAPHVFSRTPARGGAGDPGPYTALGVFHSMRAACERLFGEASPAGRRVLVVGLGSVGAPLVALLREAGAEVMVSDLREEAVRRAASSPGVRGIPPSDVEGTACDLYAPCALGGTLNAGTIPRLRCRAVVGPANNQLAAEDDAARLAAAGILYAPDFVVNAGGAIAITGLEILGWTRERVEKATAGIGDTLREVFARADSGRMTTSEAALQMARDRLDSAPAADPLW